MFLIGNSLDEELMDMVYHGSFMSAAARPCDLDKYKKECLRSQVFGHFLARTGFYHMDHLMDSIVVEALSEHSIFKGKTNLYCALRKELKEKHTIQVNTRTTTLVVSYEEIEAYHLSSFEFRVLERILRFNEHYYDRSREQESFELRKYSRASDIILHHFDASEDMEIYENIHRNFFVSICNRYGSPFRTTQSTHIYWLEDCDEYAVIYHSY